MLPAHSQQPKVSRITQTPCRSVITATGIKIKNVNVYWCNLMRLFFFVVFLNPDPQLVLDDSERIRDMLQNFRPVLDEISAVCDVSAQEDTLNQNDQGVQEMQRHLLEPLAQLLQAAVVSVSYEGLIHFYQRLQVDGD